MDCSDVLEELLGWDEFRQPGQQLSHVDEVHWSQNILEESQQAQRRAKQELLAVPAEHVPHPTRQVQRQRLAVQSEDPAGTKARKRIIQLFISTTDSELGLTWMLSTRRRRENILCS